MFHVYKLDCEGNPILLDGCQDEDCVDTSIEKWSNTYPHAIIDYVYKDTN